MAEGSDAALERLRSGNSRFLTRVTPEDLARAKLSEGQSPYAIVLACADSRVAPEVYFDAGLGEIFVVRVAGNVATVASVASIEYAVSQLGTTLIVVLAHESCGAVGAAIQGDDAGRNLNRLLEFIEPAVRSAGENVDVVARRNARLNADRLVSDSEILRKAVEQGRVRIVTAFASFTTGRVDFD